MSKKASKDCYLLTYSYINDLNDYTPTTTEYHFDTLKKAERYIENLKKELGKSLNFYRLEKITLITEYYVKKWTKC